jgi:hypothetical protein
LEKWLIRERFLGNLLVWMLGVGLVSTAESGERDRGRRGKERREEGKDWLS